MYGKVLFSSFHSGKIEPCTTSSSRDINMSVAFFFRQTLPNYPLPSILVYLLFLLNIWEIILVKDYLNVLYVHQNIHNQIKFSTVLFLISVFRDIVIADFFYDYHIKWLLSSINSIISDLKWSKSKINYWLSEIK